MKHVLQYERKKLSQPEQDYIDLTVQKATDNNVLVHLIQKRSVTSGVTQCNGFMAEDPPCLVVATGKAKASWFQTFIHESCHMDQLIEQPKAWTDTKVYGSDTNDLVFLWLEHKIELTKRQLKEYIHPSAMVELDCEKRVAQKILKHNLDIDVDVSIQRANAYVYFYLMLAKTRRWYVAGREPYNIKQVWSQMPNHFNNDYTSLPEAYARLFQQHCLR